MTEEFLHPLSIDTTDFESHKLGALIKMYVKDLPDWENADMAIFGVEDGRGGDDNHGSSAAPDTVRAYLYDLTAHKSSVNIVDLGNIKAGKTFMDTHHAVQDIVESLLSENVIPIVLGGGMELSYAMYHGFEKISRNVELSVVSPQLDLVNEGYLKKMILHDPNYLFNLNLLAYQGHYADPEAIHTLGKLYFNPIRLGVIRQHLKEVEPVLRNTDLFVFDIGALKHSDAPGNEAINPNGLTSEEACQLCWYAGVSEKARAFGVFEINPEFDHRYVTSKLGAQMIWYFLDGYYNRKGDHPNLHNEFMRYRCTMTGGNPDAVFLKSKRTDRWWMEIPDPKSMGNTGRNLLIPCSYKDYQTATSGEMPERFWQALQKLAK